MIRFACPACNAVMSVPPNAAGKKGNCPKCGQRLRIPQPPAAKHTTLGRLLPDPGAGIAAPAIRQPQSWQAPAAPQQQPTATLRPRRRRTLVAVVVIGVVFIVAGAGAAALCFSKWRAAVVVGNKGGGAVVVMPPAYTPHDGPKTPDEKRREIVAQIANHRFWKAKPTATAVEEMVLTLAAQKSGAAVLLDENAKCAAVTVNFPLRQLTKADSLAGQPQLFRQLPEGFRDRYVFIEMADYDKRPDERTLLKDFLDKLDHAEWR
jgi:hypothetical protein